MDLGSGVGSTVIQASLQYGCSSFGCELLPAPAALAQAQLGQIKVRCSMWGVAIGEVELHVSDMLYSVRVDQLIPMADAVMINNKAFLPDRELSPILSSQKHLT